MTTLVVLGLITAAFFVGRLVQWTKDARDAMGSRRRAGRGPR